MNESKSLRLCVFSTRCGDRTIKNQWMWNCWGRRTLLNDKRRDHDNFATIYQVSIFLKFISFTISNKCFMLWFLPWMLCLWTMIILISYIIKKCTFCKNNAIIQLKIIMVNRKNYSRFRTDINIIIKVRQQFYILFIDRMCNKSLFNSFFFKFFS